MAGLPGEFSLIARHFAPLAGPGALGLTDDAAVLTPPPGRELVLSADAMVGGVHFLADDPPDLVARKLLRVNLSDLAAKGATPLGYLAHPVGARAARPMPGSRASPRAWRRTSASSGSRCWAGIRPRPPGRSRSRSPSSAMSRRA